MHWIAPTEKNAASTSLEKRLWDAAGQFRANSGLKAQEYSGPILGLIFLRFAEVRFAAQRAKLELLKKIFEIPATLDFDAFGRIYEYFLGEFAMSEGQGGGEFYTPASIVQLLAQVIEPFHGRILDPACGSGGRRIWSPSAPTCSTP
jgi:type I restriction-modification system DNA methylase subunit